MKIYTNLQELTGHESGAVLYPGGEIWVGNWAGIAGLPRQFITGLIGLGEPLAAERCATPIPVMYAMQDHERAQDGEVSKSGFRAWKVNDSTVVIQKGWA